MKKFLACWAIVALLLTTNTFADKADDMVNLIKQIQSLTRDASWTPAITSVSRLSEKEAAKLCGLIAVFPEKNLAPRNSTPLNVRGSADLRKQGVVTEIKNQAQCGSCWAFAATSCVEIVNGGKMDLAEQQLVSCDTYSQGCNGGYIDTTFKWIMEQGGLVTESEYPYTSGGGDTGECQQVSGGKTTIGNFDACGADDQMKAALDAGNPIDTGFYVYQDFFSYSSGVYKHVTGGMAGGHAVCIVGYDDSKKCWIVKNSWGEGWGEKGFFRIAYDNGCNWGWMAATPSK